MPKLRKPIFARRRAWPVRGNGSPIEAVQIKRYTNFAPPGWPKSIPVLRRGKYVLDERPVIGDAPKDFIAVYQYRGVGVRRDDWRTWPQYIAKVGHQYYPAESITEQLMTRLGQVCGLAVTDSTLMICDGQLRFLSEYFRGDGEILNHGAEILAGYLVDLPFVEGVAEERAEKELFTFEVFCTAIGKLFPNAAEEILSEFVRMIGFDALVGNQDRHFYNWGVLTKTVGPSRPRFAPIFDTARGLFWNYTEDGLKKYLNESNLKGYVDRSRPQIGCDGWNAKGSGELGHFDLVGRIAASSAAHRATLENVAEKALACETDCAGMIDAEFGTMLSELRRGVVKRCLHMRFRMFADKLGV